MATRDTIPSRLFTLRSPTSAKQPPPRILLDNSSLITKHPWPLTPLPPGQLHPTPNLALTRLEAAAVDEERETKRAEEALDVDEAEAVTLPTPLPIQLLKMSPLLLQGLLIPRL